MKTLAERARKSAFREWLRGVYFLPSNYDISKWEEAFIAGWDARNQYAGKAAHEERR